MKWMIRLLCLLLLNTACTIGSMQLPPPLSEPAKAALVVEKPIQVEEVKRHTRVESVTPLVGSLPDSKQEQKLALPSGKLSLNADGMPLNRFIHLALGEVLKLAVEVDPIVAKRVDLVTLHIGRPVTASVLLGMVEDTLALFDVGLSRSANVVHILPASKVSKAMPEIATDRIRALVRMGRIIAFIPLRYALPGEAAGLARRFLSNSMAADVTIYARLNAVLVIGKAAEVSRLQRAVAMIDRPSLKGKYMRLIYPVYWKVEELSAVLEKILKARGIPLAHTAIRDGVRLIPVPEINAMIVVSPDKEWMNVLIAMAKRLDLPKAISSGSKRFIYFVKNTRAKELGAVVMQVLSGKSGSVGELSSPPPLKSLPKSGKLKQMKLTGASNKLQGAGQTGALAVIIDAKRNALIFVGDAKEYHDLLPLLQTLDKPPKQVLIEATVAEVKLDNTTQFGVEAAVNNVDHSSTMTGLLSTIGGLGVGTAGLTYSLLNAAGAVRVKINALASEGKAKVLATPTLLALDGEEASMQIGDQVAVLTQEVGSANAVSGNSTGLLRSFSYVDTGVILKVTPTINEGGVVRLKIHQEVSTPGASSNNTPPIARRSVDTTLVAKSGQTVLIAGLIRHQVTIGRTKVPLLGDIPILGHLFSNDTTTDVATELIILITPHIISGSDDAEYLTRAFRDKLGWGGDENSISAHGDNRFGSRDWLIQKQLKNH